MRESIDEHQQRRNRYLALILFVGFFVFFLALCVVGVASFRSIRTKQFIADTEANQNLELELNKQMMIQELAEAAGDVRFLATQTELVEYWQAPNSQSLERIEEEYQSFAQAKRRYDQVRLLDMTGQEQARVNFIDGKAIIVPRDQLQDKSDRPYFLHSRDLEPGKVYISPLDLNVEKGKLEIPYKPMIRFVAVSYDEHHQPRGMVVLNLLAGEFLAMLRQADQAIAGDLQLVNQAGYWMYHGNDQMEWGWQVPSREGYNLQTMHPRAWQKLQTSQDGEIVDVDGTHYQVVTISLHNVCQKALINMISPHGPDRMLCTKSGEKWFLVSTIPKSVVAGYQATLNGVLNYFLIISAAVLLLPSWGMAHLVVTWYRRRKELYRRAHFDKLTNLPNRALFMDRMEQVHRQAERYRRSYALLFIDLDGFKAVNDSLGHDAGDELLCVVGQRIGECIRRSDIAARMGGDEFVVVLSEITNRESATNVAQKIIQILSVPVELESGRVSIGCSIGIAIFPEDGKDTTELLFKSDAAMYRAKTQGKGRFCTTQEPPAKKPVPLASWRA